MVRPRSIKNLRLRAVQAAGKKRFAVTFDPDSSTTAAVLVLNYNGRDLLGECLPSVLRAAAISRHNCKVWVIDNASSDGSVEFLAQKFPGVGVIRRPNRGLCSFNEVLAGFSCPVAVLLNNDVKLDEQCIDPLVAPLLQPPGGKTPCFMTAPLCWQFDEKTYEGQRTAVRWRIGLVQATSMFPGHQSGIYTPGETASAGAAIAVDREKFVTLGGFDPLYLPGRIEDLDFAFRGFMAGYHARHVPEAVAYHKGLQSFGAAFSPAGCDQLALRNTLLFQWKNLRHPWHVVHQIVGLPLRLLRDVVSVPFVSRTRRWAFCRALHGALGRLGKIQTNHRPPGAWRRERQFFREFHPSVLSKAVGHRCGDRHSESSSPKALSESAIESYA